MSVPNQKSQLDPDEAQSQTACTSIVYDYKDLSLSDAMSVPNPNSLLDPDEACCSSSSTATISVSKELSFSDEKLEDVQDTDKSKCSELQTHFSDQHFGGACPKKFSRDMGANQGVTKEKLECSEDINESKCSEMQMDSPKQHLGACSKDFHKDSVDQAISDQGHVPKKYYAVSFPSEDFIIKDDPLIFEKKEDVIKAIKQNPEARFREFNTKREALEYASIPYETRVSSSLPEANQKFKILEKQELVKFEKCLENGNINYFLRLVWSNPRYLINENGYPTVIKEEAEWNALHIAAISGQIEIFLEILHVLQDIQFMAILHPKEEISKIQAHIRCLVGFYLNTREKVFSGTPLCLACRFGHSGFLSVILPHSESLLKNQLDKNIICQSHNCSTVHKRSMLNLFTEMYYVPVLQDEMCKFVDNLCDAQTVLAAVTTHPLKNGTTAIYCAFVGPAPFPIARGIYHHLKEKKCTFLKTPLNIVLAPSQKHIEKAGRKMAKQYNTGWIEYWRSLDAWLDISSSNGLQFLENHLSKLNDQVDSPLFFDMIKNFVEEFLDKISELTITYNTLCLFNELQSLVLFMDCFISYSFSNDKKLFDIHEELGHILFLKLTDDNRRNLKNFQMLKLLLISKFSYVTCYQKSMWKMFCCILRFAFYFQQDCKFVTKPACFCDFAIVEDLYAYSSKSCYFKLLSWRQDITNELVQKALVENTLSEEIESILLSLDKEKEDLAANISMLELKDNTSYAEFQAPIYKKYFLQSTTFIFSYCTLIVNGYGTFQDVLKNIHDMLESWKPICKLNYQQDIHLTSIHYEMAFCLFVQFNHMPDKIMQWTRMNLKGIPSSTRSQSIASTSQEQEWTHLVCVTNLLLSMLDGNVSDTFCQCHYNTDTAVESVHPLQCVMVLRDLRKRLMSLKVQTAEFQKKYNLVQSKEEDRRKKEEEYVTPPDSLSGIKSIYVDRGILSNEDINIYHALLEARVDISKYENIKKWKNLMKHTLAPLQE